MAVVNQSNLQIQYNPYWNPNGFFFEEEEEEEEMRKLILKFLWNFQNGHEKEKAGGLTLPDLNLLQSHSNKNSVVLAWG